MATEAVGIKGHRYTKHCTGRYQKLSEDTDIKQGRHPWHPSKRNWYDGSVMCFSLKAINVHKAVTGGGPEHQSSLWGWLLKQPKRKSLEIMFGQHHNLPAARLINRLSSWHYC